ncbi:MAG: hypothetical protein JJT76_08870 [Clostridiaceae bacterium]|nr:hypothetical protein [Clostridiaceae bacterium]
MKEFLSKKEDIKFAYFDISADFGALKRFLKIRDNDPAYDVIRQQGKVGVPTVIIDDKVMVEIEEEELEQLL